MNTGEWFIRRFNILPNLSNNRNALTRWFIHNGTGDRTRTSRTRTRHFSSPFGHQQLYTRGSRDGWGYLMMMKAGVFDNQ